MYGDLIPMDLQDELIAMRDTETRNGWRIADICQEVLRYNGENGRMVPSQAVYASIGLFLGRASRTVREFHSLGLFYPPEIRERFSELAFDHFRTASRLGQEKSLLALQWAVDQTEFLNRPATVDAMIAQFADVTSETPDEKIEEEITPMGQIHKVIARDITHAEIWLSWDLPPSVIEIVADFKSAAQTLQRALKMEMDAMGEEVKA